MNHRFTTFIRELQSVRLSDASFARMRATLSQYADLHPMPEAAAVVSVSMFSFLWSRQAMAMAVVVLVVGAGGGAVSFGAEKALPGDALYSLKVGVNERVALALADTPTERADVSTKLAVRRADEALVLLAEGKLDTETATYLDTQLAAHVEDSNEAATELEADGDIGASLAVRAELEEELEARVATLPAEAPTAKMMVAEDTSMAMMAFSAPAEEAPADPAAQFHTALRVRLMEVAEARHLAEAALLPGLADAGVDVHVLADEPVLPVAVEADSGATATLMLDTGTSTEEAEVMNAKVRQAPPPSNAWPDAEPFWLR